jgi:hypothetical protein
MEKAMSESNSSGAEAGASESMTLEQAIVALDEERRRSVQVERYYMREREETVRLRVQNDECRKRAEDLDARLHIAMTDQHVTTQELSRALGFIEALQGARMPGQGTRPGPHGEVAAMMHDISGEDPWRNPHLRSRYWRSA